MNARDTQGNTALIHAVLVSDAPDVVKALIDAGSDVNTRGNSGKRPIDLLDERSDKDTFAGSAAYTGDAKAVVLERAGVGTHLAGLAPHVVRAGDMGIPRITTRVR